MSAFNRIIPRVTFSQEEEKAFLFSWSTKMRDNSEIKCDIHSGDEYGNGENRYKITHMNTCY
jgi:hypothetical protein